MSNNKRAMALSSFAIFALVISATASSNPSFASESHSPRPTPRASASPTPRPSQSLRSTPAPRPSSMEKLGNTFSATNTNTLQPTAPAQSSNDCVKTNSVAHYPIRVGYPDPRVPMTDRVFTLTTNCGDITFKAFGKKAPSTVIAMTFLARSGYFDHSLCHRLTTASIFVLQCGDPTASGSGGPPFSYRDENLPADAPNDYPAGTIAMANSGPNTNGSQFFIVYKDTYLPPSYTIWGVVTQGLDVVKQVASAGVVGGGTDGTPKQTIAIESVSVK